MFKKELVNVTFFTVAFYLQKNQLSRCLQNRTPLYWKVNDFHWLAKQMKLLRKYDGQKMGFLWMQGPAFFRLGQAALLLLKKSWLLTVVNIPAWQSTGQALHRLLLMSQSQVIWILNIRFNSDSIKLNFFTHLVALVQIFEFSDLSWIIRQS